jgi:hypothetical protein
MAKNAEGDCLGVGPAPRPPRPIPERGGPAAAVLGRRLISIKASGIEPLHPRIEERTVFPRADELCAVMGAVMIDFGAIARTEAIREPFQCFATENVLSAVDLAAIRRDFPDIRKPGLFPLSELSYGPAFAALIEDIRSQELEDVMAEKYGVDLFDKPLMITVRGRARKKDGRIHTDTKAKFVTCLLYLNEIWDQGGGRLRMLRKPGDLGDYIVEIPPSGGTLASFLRAENSWHGHEPYVGERRCVMFNWMTTPAALEHELGRHRFSAKVKQLNPFM